MSVCRSYAKMCCHESQNAADGIWDQTCFCLLLVSGFSDWIEGVGYLKSSLINNCLERRVELNLVVPCRKANFKAKRSRKKLFLTLTIPKLRQHDNNLIGNEICLSKIIRNHCLATILVSYGSQSTLIYWWTPRQLTGCLTKFYQSNTSKLTCEFTDNLLTQSFYY